MFNYLIAFSFFTFGNFALFDLLGFRRELQILSTCAVCVVCIVSLTRAKSLHVNHYILYVLAFSLFTAVNGVDIYFSCALLYSALISVYIENSKKNICQGVLRAIVNILAIFSFLAIIQFFLICIAGPQLAQDAAIFNDQYLNSKSMILFGDGAYGAPDHPYIRIFGLVDATGFSIGDYYFTRMRSFLHEPSLAASMFLLPAICSILIGSNRIAAPCLIVTFCVLSFAWSVFLILAVGVLLILFKKYCIRRPILLINTSILGFFIILYCIAPLLLNGIYSFDSATDKYISNVSRLLAISSGFSASLDYFIVGNHTLLPTTLGLAVASFYYGGVFLLCYSIVVLNKILNMTTSIPDIRNIKLFGVAIFQAYLFELYTMNDYGLLSPIGLVSMGCLYSCLGKARFK